MKVSQDKATVLALTTLDERITVSIIADKKMRKILQYKNTLVQVNPHGVSPLKNEDVLKYDLKWDNVA